MTRTMQTAATRSRSQKAVDEAPAGLSWTEFSERYFPGHRRHDFATLRAWQKYVAAR